MEKEEELNSRQLILKSLRLIIVGTFILTNGVALLTIFTLDRQNRIEKFAKSEEGKIVAMFKEGVRQKEAPDGYLLVDCKPQTKSIISYIQTSGNNYHDIEIIFNEPYMCEWIHNSDCGGFKAAGIANACEGGTITTKRYTGSAKVSIHTNNIATETNLPSLEKTWDFSSLREEIVATKSSGQIKVPFL
ncbi:MAG: hypothetical protein COT81_04865 [Candidatus Buchananbacteria bacterium CG10_big_fil_rev_8_21_14_0_10_42_9]|uniref:Uncharacterized protein n=1 Tax=Candidatus Buchananbacteria bacterium CG10_big_fil_rev_8_21_14_0_10_42_9 TaxID=1974526 RepID=A0A2H0W042_9BACT|nr:MAG: hypothetical protein COT81_04865 [Candidatus Buchananbacteria bacterium CG10_big_fil_rev_8_21_14_0_10_42_9]